MVQKILLDTNFIMIPAQFKVDIYSEIKRICPFKHELYVLDKSLMELDTIIEEQRGKNKAAARLAKAILEAQKPKTLKTTSKDYVDSIILDLEGFIVATQDRVLRADLKKKGVKTIVLRQKKYLILE
ncbi:MAG TPA: nucleotide-binding protein [Candidatus Nanoarchaeia archaeon]|nr:nucleotide-binding protein [Candidatus Nanoarchaeia archaeon]